MAENRFAVGLVHCSGWRFGGFKISWFWKLYMESARLTFSKFYI